MRNSIWNKRIPTLAGLLLIALGIGTITYLTGHRILFLGNAAASEEPKNIQITNLTDSSFTVVYTTDATVIGSIAYGIDKNIPQTAFDDRDQPNGTPTLHNVHSVTVKKLQPKVTYYFSIKSGEETYLNNNQLYQIVTGTKINAPPSAEKPITGKILSSTGDPPSEALILVKIKDSQTVSTLAKPTGFFIIPINAIRSGDLTSYVPVQDGDTLMINAVTDTASSQVTFTLGGENSVAPMTLSQNYDFTQAISATPASGSSHLVSLPNSIASSSATAAINQPGNNAGLVDTQPNIRGTAPPNTMVDIEIHSSEVVKGTVTADSSGFWSFRPNIPLSPGLHTLTAIFRDSSGILKTITQSFTVYAQGSQVDQSATPSATPIVTSSPTQTPTQTVTPTNGLTVTVTQTVTPTVSVNPSAIPTSGTVTGRVTPSPTPRFITGNETIPWIGVLGVASGIIGMILFLATLDTTL